MKLKWYCNQQNNTEIRDAWCAELSAENNAEIRDAWCAELSAENNTEFWSSDALESLKEYKMCKDGNVKHLVKKIISVYTMHWSALKMWFQLTHYFQYWMIMSWQDLKKNIFLVEVDKSSLGKDEHCCKIYVLIYEMILHTNQ